MVDKNRESLLKGIVKSNRKNNKRDKYDANFLRVIIFFILNLLTRV